MTWIYGTIKLQTKALFSLHSNEDSSLNFEAEQGFKGSYNFSS